MWVNKNGRGLLRKTDLWIWGVLLFYILGALVYQSGILPFWVEGFGAVQIPLCGNQGTLVLPGKVPRSYAGDQILPERAAGILSRDGKFRLQVGPGGQQVTLVEQQEYRVWVLPDFPHPWLDVWVTTAAGCTQYLQLSVESRTEYVGKRFFAILFGIPLVSLVTLVALLYKGYLDYLKHQRERELQKYRQEQELREVLQAIISRLRQLPPSQRIRTYLHMLEEEKDPQLIQRLQIEWSTYWSSLPERERWEMQQALLTMWLQALEGTPGQEFSSAWPPETYLKYFPQVGFFSNDDLRLCQTWQQVFRSGRFQGSQEHLVVAPQWLRLTLHPSLYRLITRALVDFCASHGDVKSILDRWQQRYGLAGYFLAHQIYLHLQASPARPGDNLTGTGVPEGETPEGENCTAEIRKALRVGIARPPSPRPVEGPLALWRSSPSPHAQSLGSDRAEFDDALPKVFYEKYAAWEALLTERHTWYWAPSGHGTTALIWMGRYRYRYWAPEPGFSLYLLLDVPPTLIFWQNRLQRALSDAILYNLLQDFSWLLAAPLRLRSLVMHFLLAVYEGNMAWLLHEFRTGGLHEDDLHYRLLESELLRQGTMANGSPPPLEEVLEAVQTAMQYYGTRLFNVLKPIRPRILIEIASHLPPPMVEHWTRWLLERDEGPWTLGYTKVFSPHPLPEALRESTPSLLDYVEIKWDKSTLHELLFQRYSFFQEQAMTPEVPDPDKLNADIAALIEAFEREGGVLAPRPLISFGNERLPGLRSQGE